MKKLLLLLFCYSVLINSHGQSIADYHQAIAEGDKEFKKGEYKSAINFYFAAAAYMPENKGEIKGKVNKAFDAINALRKKAEDALAESKKQTALALEAKKEAEKQKEIARQALERNLEFLKKDVGKKYQGGIIFYADSAREHGLIAAENDLDSNYSWDEAKKACQDYSVIVDGVTYDDWFLPSKDTLALLYLNKDKVGNFKDFYYCSSSKCFNINAWYQNFGDGVQGFISMGATLGIRAVRAF